MTITCYENYTEGEGTAHLAMLRVEKEKIFRRGYSCLSVKKYSVVLRESLEEFCKAF